MTAVKYTEALLNFAGRGSNLFASLDGGGAFELGNALPGLHYQTGLLLRAEIEGPHVVPVVEVYFLRAHVLGKAYPVARGGGRPVVDEVLVYHYVVAGVLPRADDVREAQARDYRGYPHRVAYVGIVIPDEAALEVVCLAGVLVDFPVDFAEVVHGEPLLVVAAGDVYQHLYSF